MYERETDPASDGEAAVAGKPFKLKRPLRKLTKFPKIFLNVIAGESLARRIDNWIDGKVQGNKYIATHHFFGDSIQKVDERTPARKGGNIRRGKKVKI